MTKNELAINNWVRHRDQGEKPYRITSITIDGDKYLYTAEGLTKYQTANIIPAKRKFIHKKTSDCLMSCFIPLYLNAITLNPRQTTSLTTPKITPLVSGINIRKLLIPPSTPANKSLNRLGVSPKNSADNIRSAYVIYIFRIKSTSA